MSAAHTRDGVQDRLPPSQESVADDLLPQVRYVPDLLARHRIKITLLVFVLLMAVQMLVGLKPEDPLNLSDASVVIGSAAIATGLAIRSWAAGTLVKKERLACNGPYSLVRHPLYLGSTLMMVGFTLLTAMWWNVAVALAVAVICFGHAIRQEEAFLAQKFGDRWTAYASRAGRVLPCGLAGKLLAPWQWRLWLQNREYNAWIGSLLGWIGLVWWG
jgi:protein-S-isoprenylcysteine O-methyltransferase Ste14